MLLEMRDVKKEKSIGAEKYDCMLNSGKKKKMVISLILRTVVS